MKTADKILIGLGILVLAGVFAFILADPANKFGVSVAEPSFTSTNVATSTVACGTNASGTQITVAQPGRMKFRVYNTNPNAVHICLNTTCEATSPIIIAASTTAPSFYEQIDAYIGPYSCIGTAATTTINVLQGR